MMQLRWGKSRENGKRHPEIIGQWVIADAQTHTQVRASACYDKGLTQILRDAEVISSGQGYAPFGTQLVGGACDHRIAADGLK